jgi:group I intron endonuclease
VLSGIYVIKNKLNGKEYYGQAFDLKRRMSESHKECKRISSALKKYGKECFEIKLILYCEKWELNRLEMACIRAFHSHISEGGYNIAWGGNAPMIGRKHSIVTLKKYKDGRRKGKNNPSYGTTRSDSAKKTIGKANSGRIVTDETRQKMSDARRGEKNYNYGKRGTLSLRYGTHHTEKTKRLISVSQSGENSYNYGKAGEKSPTFGIKHPSATSKYFGVSKKINKRYIYWVARIKENYKAIHIGYFKTELKAALAYDKYIKENKINRPLNFTSL